MITNFEEITEELNDYELSIVDDIVSGFKKRTSENPIKAPEIIKAMKARGFKITEPRLRKICNHIRSNSIIPLIATHKGYYISYDQKEIARQISSLQERARSIQQCAEGMKSFLR